LINKDSDLNPLIPASEGQSIDAATKRGRIQMILLFLVCAAPVIVSYFTFYVIKPTGGNTKIGELVYPVQSAPIDSIDASLQGKWTMLIARPSAECKVGKDECVNLLYLMRQVRIAMGRESQRVQLVWLVTDQGDIDPEIAKAYDLEVAGFTFVRMPKDATKKNEVEKWLELDGKKSAIHLLDPRADRMMRFDTDKEVPDFKRVSKDLGKLLKWNATGKAK
jgi:hypothetical protein